MNPTEKEAQDIIARLREQTLADAATVEAEAESILAQIKGSAYPSDKQTADGYVHDGDTVEGRRLVGGNTPELKTQGTHGSAMPMSIEAQQRTEQLIESGDYQYQGTGKTGFYGRDLGSYIDAEGNTIMQRLLREGYASPTDFEDAGNSWDNQAAYNQMLSEFDATGSTHASRNQQYDYGQFTMDPDAGIYDGRSIAGRAWDRGVDMMQMNLFQFTELMGEFSSIDAMKEWGEQGVLDNMYEASLSPAEIESTDDIESLRDVGYYILERMIENSPNILADLGIGAATAAATVATGGAAAVVAPAVAASIGKSFVARVGAKQAFKAGFGGSMYAQMAGESRHAQLQEGVDNPLLALGTGGAKTVTEMYGLQRILKSFMPKGQITDAAGLAKHIGKQAVINTGVEGSTEFIQDLTDQLAIKMAKPGYEIDWNQLNESFWAGAAAGGGTSTTLAAAGGTGSYILNRSRIDKGNLNTNTIPETQEALQSQMNEVIDPSTPRDTVLDPQGEVLSEETAPEGVIVTTHEDGSVAATTNPEKAALHKEQGMGAAKELRGYQKSKEEIVASGEATQVVTRFDADGNEMSSELVVESDVDAARAREQSESKPGDNIVVRSPEQIDLKAERNAGVSEQIRDANTATQAVNNQETEANIDEIADPAAPVLDNVERAEYEDAPSEEQGTASLFNENNELRPAADLIRDIVEKRLSVSEIIYELGDQFTIDEELIKATGVAIDRKATLQALVNKGVSEDALLAKNTGGRRRGYRSIETLLADPQLTDQAVEDLARKYGVTPVAISEFNMNAVIARIARKLRDPMLRRKLPDDLRAAAFLFENPTSELVRDTTNVDPRKHQKRGEFINNLRPIADPAAAIRAELDKYESEGAKKQALVRIANAVGESIKAADRDGSNKDLLVERDAAAAKIVQKIHNNYAGARKENTQTTPETAESTQPSEREKTAIDPEQALTWAKMVDTAEQLLFRHWKTGAEIDPKAAVNNLTNKELVDLTTAFLTNVNESILETIKSAYSLDQAKLIAMLKPIIDAQQNPKAIDKEQLIRSLRAALKPFIDTDTDANETAIPDIESEIAIETQQIVQDTAVMLKLLKKAYGDKAFDPFEALASWTPESPELDTDAAKAKIIEAAQESSLQVRASQLIEAAGEIGNEAVEKIQEGISPNNVRQHIEGTLIGLTPEKYDRSERDAAIWSVADTENGHSQAKAPGDSFTNIPDANEQEASNRSFMHRLMAAEVRFGTTFTDYIFGAKNSDHSASTIRNTRLAEGRNLLNVVVTNLQNGKTENIALDAVRLAQMGLRAMPGAESNRFSGDLLAGLYVAIDRMSPDEMASIGYSRAYATLTDQLPDDLVVAVDEGRDGPIITTLGDARKAEAELNADNPRWKRGQNKEEYFVKIDALYDEMAGIRAELAKRDDAEVQPAIDWLDTQLTYQVDQETRETTPPSKLGAKPKAESPAKYLQRVSRERSAVRKFSNRALQINDEIVMLRNRSRAEQYIDVLDRDDQDQNFQDHPDHSANKPRTLDDDFKDAHGIVEQSRKNEASEESFETMEPASGVGTSTKVDTNIIGLGRAAKKIGRLLRFATNRLGMKTPTTILSLRELNNPNARRLIADRVANTTLSQEENTKRVTEVVKALRAKMANGENGAFIAQNGQNIIVINDSLTPAQQMAVASHEIGHAVFNAMTDRSRNVLEQAYRVQFELDESDTIDNEQLHEWVADQVSNYIAGRGRSIVTPLYLKEGDSKVVEAINAIIDRLVRLWREAVREFSQYDAAPLFVDYFERALGRKSGLKNGESIMFGSPYQSVTPDSEQVFNMPAKEAARKIRQAGAKAKQIHKSKWRPVTAVVRAVYSRISDYSKTLSAELYQKSQTGGPEAYEQIQNFLRSQMQAEMAKLEQKIGLKPMEQGFKDVRAGLDTTEAKEVRAMIDKVNALMKGYVPTMRFRDNFIPEAFDHVAIEKEREQFEALLVEYGVFEAGEVHGLVQDLLYTDGVTDFALAPGKAVSTHQSVNRILSKVPAQKLMDAGYLLDNPHAIMSHYIATGAKRAAWEYKFGGYTDQYQGDAVSIRFKLLEQAGVDTTGMGAARAEAVAKELKLEKDGLFYSPNHRFNEYLEQIRQEHGEPGVKAVKELLDSAMGRLGNDISPALRSSFDWISTWMNLTLLAFSGVASIPELAGSVIRSRGQLNLADFKDAIGDLKDARQFALDLGIVLTDGAEQMALETMGVQYSSPAQHKISQVFFKINGQQFITRLSRTMAVSTGRQFLLRTAERAANGDTAAAEELAMLHIDADTVNNWAASGKPNDNLRVNAALNQFVFESSLKPSRFEATKWGNNPYFKLAWHLKQFFYSFGTVIIGGILRHTAQKYKTSVDNGQHMIPAAAMASMPLLVAAMAFLPLAGLAEELREFIKHGTKGGRTDKMGAGRYLQLLSAKAGALGPFEVVASMHQAYEWNNSSIAATMPAAGFIETMLDPDVSAEKKLKRITPFYSQGAFGWVFE